MFTGHEFGEGGSRITRILQKEGVKASFFFTGDFYRNPSFTKLIQQLKKEGHYLGAHSDKHLLYNDWSRRDSLLVSRASFTQDLLDNYKAMQRFGIGKEAAQYFLPPYEWYNDSIVAWTAALGLQLVNLTPGTLSHADYTTPADRNYRSSDQIYRSILSREKEHGLNGYLLLMHVGAGPARRDKFYDRLPQLIQHLKAMGYRMVTVDGLLGR